MVSNPQIDKYGSQRWFNKEEQLHRVDGPAIIHPNGAQIWFQNGLRHRLNGPAVIWANGSQFWLQNDLLHRTDGPAIIYASGEAEWWLNGAFIREELEINSKLNWKRYGF